MRAHKINSRRALLTRAARKITRRRLIACAGAAACTARTAWGKPMMFRGGSPIAAPPSSSIAGVRVLNTAGTDTPADVPYTVKMEFARGEVPVGYIAVPQVSSVDQIYQMNDPTYWDDGSLFSCVFYIIRNTAHAAGAYISFDFNVRAGSYSNTSSTTLTNMAAADYKINVSNCHTASVDLNDRGYGHMVALTVSGGSVTGTKVWRISPRDPDPSATQKNVLSLIGTGAKLTLTAGVPSIDVAGSGYNLVNGTGAATISLATAINAVVSSGNHANGVSADWYARGPAVDACLVKTTVPGFNHLYGIFWIERWKKTDGSFLCWNAVGKIGTLLVDTTGTIPIPNYTYDLDWIGPDGTTVIRGASSAYAPHTTIIQWMATASYTFAEDAQPDWSANSAAYNALKPMRTLAQCDHQKLAGLQMPWRAATPSRTPPSTHSAYESGQAPDGGVGQISDYWPTGTAGLRCPLGPGGGGNVISPTTEIDGLYWQEQRAGRTSNALFYLRNIEVAAASSSQLAQLGNGIYEPTTMYVPNVIPSGVQTFTGMTPSRSAYEIHNSYINMSYGSGNPHINLGGANDFAGNTYHNMCSTLGAYLATGRRWWMDSLFDAANVTIYGAGVAHRRQVTIGTTTYYGTKADYVNNTREMTWQHRGLMYALAVRPTAWADGTADPQQAHLEFCIGQQLAYMTALISHTGTVKFGSTGLTLTKTQDFTNSGVDQENFDPDSSGNSIGGDVPYMLDYRMMVFAIGSYLFQGKFSNRYQTLRDYWAISYVKWWAAPGSHYYNTPYRRMVFDGPQPANPVDPNYAVPDPVNTKIMVIPAQLGQPGLGSRLSFTSGTDVVTLEAAIQRTHDGDAMLDGTRIRVTTDNVDATVIPDTPIVIPSPYDVATTYYWKGITSTTGKLCTDSGLTTTPGNASASVANVSIWIVFSGTPPADSAGRGSYRHGPDAAGNGVLYVILGTLRLLKAYGMSGTELDTALTNIGTVYNSISGAVPEQVSDMTYSWSSSRAA